MAISSLMRYRQGGLGRLLTHSQNFKLKHTTPGLLSMANSGKDSEY
jgi:hypothetical protein